MKHLILGVTCTQIVRVVTLPDGRDEVTCNHGCSWVEGEAPRLPVGRPPRGRAKQAGEVATA